MDESELKAALNELKADLSKYPLVYALASGDALIEALKKIGRSKSWFYALPSEEQKRLFEIAAELKAAPLIQAKTILDDAVVEAAQVKVGGLKNRDPRIQQPAASDILDRTLGKATSPVQLQGQNGELLKVIFEHTGNQDTASSIPSSATGDSQ